MVNIIFITFNLLFLFTGSNSVNHFVQKRQASSNYSEYSYNAESSNSPDHWQDTVASCNGNSQSPINIKTAKAKKSISLKIKSTKWTEKPTEIFLQNDGQNVIFKFMYTDRTLPYLYSNGNVYEFEQLHFHFGLTRNTGTEHHINKEAFGMESHAVFYNRKYETYKNALSYSDGLTVIGRLYNESTSYSRVSVNFDFLQYVRNPNEYYTINDTSLFSLQDVMGPLRCPCYTYHGSLTTPDCNEAVNWIITANLLHISTSNLTYFRELMGNDGLIAPNIRPLEKLNGRTVYYHRASRS